MASLLTLGDAAANAADKWHQVLRTDLLKCRFSLPAHFFQQHGHGAKAGK